MFLLYNVCLETGCVTLKKTTIVVNGSLRRNCRKNTHVDKQGRLAYFIVI